MPVLTLSLTVALMLATPVCAGPKAVVAYDSLVDLGFGVDLKESLISNRWNDNTPIIEVQYLDMVSVSLSMKANVFTFVMKLAGPLPEEGAAMPMGIKSVEWVMWIDPEPWHHTLNPVPSLFKISVIYDGAVYSTYMIDYATMSVTTVPFLVDGSTVQIQFTAASIGNLESFWWMPSVLAHWGPLGTQSYWFIDAVDRDANPGQVWEELPWGSPEWDYP